MHDPMVTIAAQRGLVRLADGRLCRLTYWPVPEKPTRHGKRPRVQMPSGAYVSVRMESIVEVLAEVLAEPTYPQDAAPGCPQARDATVGDMNQPDKKAAA